MPVAACRRLSDQWEATAERATAAWMSLPARIFRKAIDRPAICDELGIMFADGGDWCLAIFPDRSTVSFKHGEI